MAVPMLDLKAQYRQIKAEVEPVIEQLFETQGFVGGPQVTGLETDIETYLNGSGKALSCASGTDALLLSLKALGIKQGDEVITTPFSFFATAGAIVNAGAIPVFVDIDPVTYNLNPALVEAAITSRTRAIVVVHLYGQPADMNQFRQIAQTHHLPLIEDAAQAFGSRYQNQNVCTMGDAAAISFYPTKNLGGAGDGGMVIANSPQIQEQVQLLRNHGAQKTYIHQIVGTNSRLDAIQAAIVRIKLQYIDKWNEARRERAAYYNAAFTNVPQVAIPVEIPGNHHIYHQYVIRVPKRDALKTYLQERGIGCAIFYPLPLHQQECFKPFGSDKAQCPVAEKAASQVLALPMFPELATAQQDEVIQAVCDFLQ